MGTLMKLLNHGSLALSVSVVPLFASLAFSVEL